MKVMKFGGTSVGSPERIKNVARIVSDEGRKIVVLSAMSGTTNSLVEICDFAVSGNIDAVKSCVQLLKEKYTDVCRELLMQSEHTESLILAIIDEIVALCNDYSVKNGKKIIAKGEIISTYLATEYLKEQGEDAVLVSALDFMRKNQDGEPDYEYIKHNLKTILEKYSDTHIIITQGFICLDSEGNVDNLERGGSDYTATIVGGMVNAEIVEIWTDIDGVHNNDPRFVEHTHRVPQLNYEEAIALALGGAKILHPLCVYPVKETSVPLTILNTMEPDSPGTLVNSDLCQPVIKAVAAAEKGDCCMLTVAGNFCDANDSVTQRAYNALMAIEGATHPAQGLYFVKANVPADKKTEALNFLNTTLFN